MMNGLGLVGYALLLIGMRMLAKQDQRGWWFRLGGDLLWAYLGIVSGLWSITLAECLFLTIDVGALVRGDPIEQRKEREKKETAQWLH